MTICNECGKYVTEDWQHDINCIDYQLPVEVLYKLDDTSKETIKKLEPKQFKKDIETQMKLLFSSEK